MYKKIFKRPLDIFCSLLALLVFWWLFLIVAILVRIKLGSPVIFKQKRPGKDEKIFTMYKFRSMSDARDENGELLSDSERLTKFGKFLRSSSLDELPGLLNILKGDMSLVGPRPLLVEYLPLYSDTQKRRHEIRPGLTGLAQVNGRNNLPWKEKFALDVKYRDNITFLTDLKIVFATIKKAFIKREGISHEGAATMPVFVGEKDDE